MQVLPELIHPMHRCMNLVGTWKVCGFREVWIGCKDCFIRIKKKIRNNRYMVCRAVLLDHPLPDIQQHPMSSATNGD
jgi:hypothetical protein